MTRQWGVVLAGGAAAFLLGVALSVWPRETVAVVAVLVGIHLLISGGIQLVLALASRRPRPARLVAAFAGVAAVVVGLLLLFRPMQTLTFIGWAAGLCVSIMGAADLLDAVFSRSSRRRGWQAGRGVLELALGIFLVANPDLSLGLLVVIACLYLISYGFITMISAVLLRSEHRGEPDAPAADGSGSARTSS
jgi:uncharacterized membrane protein HdeD (DUF308 family)